jgi:hypothetical protein
MKSVGIPPQAGLLNSSRNVGLVMKSVGIPPQAGLLNSSKDAEKKVKLDLRKKCENEIVCQGVDYKCIRGVRKRTGCFR